MTYKWYVSSKKGVHMKPTINFNLLVTLKGQKANNVGEELLGMEEIELALQPHESILNIKDSEFANVILLDLSIKPKQALEILRNANTTVISKIVVIDEVVRTRPKLIKDKVLQIADDKINSGQSFVVRCDLRGRKYIESKEELKEYVSREVIENLNIIENDDNPDWIIQIEIIGENTGISVSKPADIIKKD
ncbi:MAG: THUMP domain-containing protein [Methanomicrobiales archaeon]